MTEHRKTQAEADERALMGALHTACTLLEELRKQGEATPAWVDSVGRMVAGAIVELPELVITRWLSQAGTVGGHELERTFKVGAIRRAVRKERSVAA